MAHMKGLGEWNNFKKAMYSLKLIFIGTKYKIDSAGFLARLYEKVKIALEQ